MAKGIIGAGSNHATLDIAETLPGSGSAIGRRTLLAGTAAGMFLPLIARAHPAGDAMPGAPARLPLGGSLWLFISREGVAIQDIDKSYLSDGSLAFADEGQSQPDAMRTDYAFSLAKVAALRTGGAAGPADCTRIDAVSVTRGTPLWSAVVRARFADGSVERWRITANPAQQRWSWHRDSVGSSSKTTTAIFELRTPRSEAMLQFWQTGSGQQIINTGVPGKIDGQRPSLTEDGQAEALYYSLLARNCLRVHCPGTTRLELLQAKNIRAPKPYEPYWEHDENKQIRENLWIGRWQMPAGTASFTASVGATAAARDFVGLQRLEPVDASADFGPFFAQVYLGALPLTLQRYPDGLIAARCNVLISEIEIYKDPWSRDIMWNAEFLYRVAPAGVAALLERYLTWRLTNPKSYSHGGDDGEIELVLMAGRHFHITGNLAFVSRHVDRYRAIMQGLWKKRPEGSDLPIFDGSWDGQGKVLGQEPYVTAEYFAALERLALMEEALGDASAAAGWRRMAAAVKAQAARPYQQGGFWHEARGTFIDYIDHAPHVARSPRQQSWAEPMPGEPATVSGPGYVRLEFALYETVVPIWLGLLDQPDRIRRAYDWIDRHYSYASGRGGFDLPPHVGQNFVLLLDACLRKRHGIGGADRIFQLANDHGLDGGIPFAEMPLGTMAGAGPQLPDGQFKFYAATHSGRTWDNAPWFGLATGLHYGIDYDHRGWSIGDPRPLSDYPLTRLDNLRHKDATFNLRWTGRGQVRGITMDGVPLASPLLTATQGTHDVRVILG